MHIYIKDMIVSQHFDGFYLVKACDIKSGKTGKEYLDMKLGDMSGEIAAKKWDILPGEDAFVRNLEAGTVIKIRADVRDWMGNKQLAIEAIRAVKDGDEYDKEALFKRAPEDPQDMYDYIVGRINAFEDEDLKKICLALYTENKEKLMYYPAAMSNHHAEYAGLLYHVKRMMMMGERACEVYPILSKDLLLAGVLIHDIEKLTEIKSDANGISSGYSFKGQMLGHIVQGVALLDKKCEELGIPEEKAVMLEHMIVSHHYEPEFGSPKKPLFPEAEMLHYLDMVDAKLFDMEDALLNVEPGEFSDKKWTLDNRKIYQRKF